MIISIMLILAVALYDVSAWALLGLLITWMPDIIFLAMIIALMDERRK